MINNRQAGRRNRGRNNNNNNNPRPNGQNRGNGDSGNRIDNRSRGNAAQLLEKYRNMARDAQLSGDRVNAEYYLQFADHYFRVLADNRSRQEEQQGGQQNRQPRRDEGYDFDGDDFDGNTEGSGDYDDRPAYAQPSPQANANREGNRENGRDGNSRDGNREGARDNGRDYNQNANRDTNRETGRDERRDRQQPRREEPRREEPRRAEPRQEDVIAQVAAPEAAPIAPVAGEVVRRGRGRPPRDRSLDVAPPAPVDAATPVQPDPAIVVEDAPRGGLRQRRPRGEAPVERDEASTLDIAVLPPAIARADNDSDVAAEEEAPRKRTRRARPATEAAE